MKTIPRHKKRNKLSTKILNGPLLRCLWTAIGPVIVDFLPAFMIASHPRLEGRKS